MKYLAALTLSILATAAPALCAPTTQIAVTGSGTVTKLPDEATVNASITTTDPSAEAATNRNNAAYETAISALTGRGIARNDVTLSYYNVNYQPKPPAVDGNPPPALQYGYTVSRSFAVKVRNMAQSGAIVDALTPIAGIDINGVAFGLANTSAARTEATAKAVADAREKATALASAAGLHITSIQRIDLEGATGIMPLPLMMKANILSASASAPTTFDPGNVNVTVNVNVVFAASP